MLATTPTLALVAFLLAPMNGFNAVYLTAGHLHSGYLPYLDPSQPVETRVEDLISRMTLREMQTQLFGVHDLVQSVYDDYKNSSFGSQKLTKYPQTDPLAFVDARNKEQSFFVNNSRLHIPLAFHQETLNSAGPGATLLPLGITLGASWNTSLLHQLGSLMATECRALGIDSAYSPEPNLYPDPRNGRGQESLSPDPYLTSSLALAQVLGQQGGTKDSPAGPSHYLGSDRVASVAKHYIAYGAGKGGINSGEASVSEYEMRDVYLRAWRSLVQRGGLRGLMRSHEQWNHIPVHAHTYLAGILNDLGFSNSWSISDCGDIVNLVHFDFATSKMQAAAMALNASVDVENQCPPGCYSLLLDAVDAGIMDPNTIKNSAKKILRHKFSLGLFDGSMYTDSSQVTSKLRTAEHVSAAYEAVIQGTTLLKNDPPKSPRADVPMHTSTARSSSVYAPSLPFNVSNLVKLNKSLVILGPAGGCPGDTTERNPNCDGRTSAGGCEAQCAMIGKTFHPIGNGVAVPTLFEIANATAGLRIAFSRAGDIDTNRTFNQGNPHLAAAAQLLKTESTIGGGIGAVVFVLGDSLKSAGEGGLEPDPVHAHGGGGDRDSLDLPGDQHYLLESLVPLIPAGVPVILVLVNGRPVTFGAAAHNVLLNSIHAVIAAGRGGEQAAKGVWDILRGAAEPKGRLAQSWPRSVGQIGGPSSPNLCAVVADWAEESPSVDQFSRGYFLSEATPLFAFGHGLSYTELELVPGSVFGSSVQTPDLNSVMAVDRPVALVGVQVRNSGKRAGTTVVQVYAHDPSGVGVVRYFWRLVGFAKLSIPAFSSANVSVPINSDSLSFVSAAPQYDFRLFSGDYRFKVALSATHPGAQYVNVTLDF